MIVRDEDATLPGCLESVRGLVDEVVIVDTGSTDRTREIAEQQAPRVARYVTCVPFEWCDDFAAARN